MSVFSKSAGVGPCCAPPVAPPDGVLPPSAATRPAKTAIDVHRRILVVVIALKRSVGMIRLAVTKSRRSTL